MPAQGDILLTKTPCRNCSCCQSATWDEYHDRMFCTYCGNPRYTSADVAGIYPCPIITSRDLRRSAPDFVLPGYREVSPGSYERIGPRIEHDPRCAFIVRGGFRSCNCGATSDLPRR